MPAPEQPRLPGNEDYYRAAIGERNQDYYLHQFARFDAAGHAGASWNWPACFATLLWLLYRKMGRQAALYFWFPWLAVVAFASADMALGLRLDSLIAIFWRIYFAAALLLPPFYANALYYRHCRKKIAQARAFSSDPGKQLGFLAAHGGVGKDAHRVAALFAVFFIIIGIGAGLYWKARQDYQLQEQLTAAAAIGKIAADAVERYRREHGELPERLEQTDFAEKIPSAISVAFDRTRPMLAVTLAASGKKLLFQPLSQKDGKIEWKCTSQEIERRLLPAACRQD